MFWGLCCPSWAPWEERRKKTSLSQHLYIKPRVSSVQVIHSVVSDFLLTLWTAAYQASLSITNSRAYSNSCPLSRWCHPTISSSHSLLLPSIFPSIRVFSKESQFFALGGQSIGASTSAVNIQDWFPLGLTGLILKSKGLSRVFSNTTVQKHQLFGTQLSL